MHLTEKRRVHFVGVGGIGMSGLAEILLNLGYDVSGSDLARSAITTRLESLGLRFSEGHAEENLVADIVVVSAAVPESNSEVAAARAQGLPVMHRSDLLADLIRLKPHAVVVGGTHGKTTTTSLVSAILDAADIGATSIIGGILHRSGTNAQWGKGDYIVAEADEHDGSFLRLHPTIAVVTNIDAEHMEYYGTIHQLQHSFAEFCNGVPFYGTAVICGDDANARAILPDLTTPFVTYGLDADCGLRATDLETFGDRPGAPPTLATAHTRMQLHATDARLGATGHLGEITVQTIGLHNARNAIAACAVSLCLGIPFDTIARGLASFQGVQRRLQVCGEVQGVTVVEDYAHHPTEIASTLQAIRETAPNRVIALFQPHLYSRTKYLYREFADVLSEFDAAYVTDIYASREDPIAGVTANTITDEAANHVVPVGAKEYAPDILAQDAQPGDIVAILGAGDINRMAEPLLKALDNR